MAELLGIIVLLAAIVPSQVARRGGAAAATQRPARQRRALEQPCGSATPISSRSCAVSPTTCRSTGPTRCRSSSTRRTRSRTRCGSPAAPAPAAARPVRETGPFYCPADNLVYIDLEFMQQLEEQLIGTPTDLAEQYIVAHEYGHHVQNLLGTNAQVQEVQQNQPDTANQYSVAMELQADCFAGVWVGARDVSGQRGRAQEAINAAEGVGDDRIQQKTQGRIDPESWTHGSAEQRRTWFLTGYNSQDPTAVRHVRRDHRLVAELAVHPLEWADPELVQPRHRDRRSRTTSSTRRRSAPFRDRRADPVQLVDEQVEHQHMADVQRERHLPGRRKSTGEGRSVGALGHPADDAHRDHRRTDRRQAVEQPAVERRGRAQVAVATGDAIARGSRARRTRCLRRSVACGAAR